MFKTKRRLLSICIDLWDLRVLRDLHQVLKQQL